MSADAVAPACCDTVWLVCRRIAEETKAQEAASAAAASAAAAAAAAALPIPEIEAVAQPNAAQAHPAVHVPSHVPSHPMSSVPYLPSQLQAASAEVQPVAGYQSMPSGPVSSIPQSIPGAMAGFGTQLPMPGLTFSNQAPITSGPVSAHAVKQDAVQMLKSQQHR